MRYERHLNASPPFETRAIIPAPVTAFRPWQPSTWPASARGSMNIASKLALTIVAAVTIRGAYAQETQTPVPPPAETSSTPSGVEDADEVKVGAAVHAVDPVFPASLRDKSMAIVLSGTMTVKGTFENLRKAAGAPELEDAAVEAVRQWLYTPSLKAGKPAEINVFITIQSNQGSLATHVEPDLPFLTSAPKPTPAEKAEIVWRVSKYGDEPGTASPPKAIYAPDPEYSEAARAIGLEDTVILVITIGANGSPRDPWVARKAGLGLDQKALATVSKWKFQPGMKDGKPVATFATIEVAFHLN